MSKIPGIEFKKNKNPTIDSVNAEFELPFYKDVEYFSNLDNFVNFIKSVEKLVRRSTFYTKYVGYIKNDIGLKCCQVLSNIEESEGINGKNKVEIDMHHGPILTLFDYASIVTDYLLAKGEKVSTFTVANILLKEHYANRIQVVMLSKTVHEQVHLNNIFINTKQAFGDLNAFLKKYRIGINDEQLFKINKYIEISENYDSFDKDILELKGFVKKWAREDD